MSTINEAFKAAISSGKIAGAHILACNSKGQQYTNLPGHRTNLAGEKLPHQLDDIIYLASGTKIITTIAALQCVEDGILDLDKPLDLGLLLDDVPKSITLRQMLSHTSGLVYPFLDPKLAAIRAADPTAQLPLVFEPGTSWMYGTGMDYAANQIPDYVDRVNRMMMGDGYFMPVTDEKIKARMIDVNPSDPGLGKAVVGGDGEMNKTGPGGGHGLCTTPTAYLAVLKSILSNDGRLLKHPEGMFENQLNDESTAGWEKACAGPMGKFFKVGVELKSGQGLGGLLTLEDVPGWYGNKTLTWGGGLTLAWFIDRQTDLAGFCAIQATLPVDLEIVTELKQVFRKGIYKEQLV